ncbi:MAG: archaellin/type IV pilin N-terminal domain-containing protein [Candidatus Bathycorpusculaceae bacterium]
MFKNKRGIVGIEAAIVLIAFIIVAAALSYVVINMGFYTTQKTRDTMQSGLEESLNALQLDGIVTGKTDDEGRIEWIVFPVKLSAGRASMDLKNDTIVVTVYLPNATLLNVYQGVFNETEYGEDPIDIEIVFSNMTEIFQGKEEQDFAMSIIYNDDGDSVLESTEKAFFIIHLDPSPPSGGKHTLKDYDIVKIEIKGAKGAALTIERLVPGGMLPKSYINLN